ncbi:glycosyltransferase [Mesorhizobium sp. CC13]|uniref:glycosyltransferase family 2 protein n=1 Tax=Mesorhizobium sp. CC13 TaxID=3029194 RepID=UPI003263EBD8
MQAPRISVITPTHNRREHLLRAVASVAAQTETCFEHIVVDDGSTDGTDAAMARLDDPRLTYVRLDKWGGANAARNRGIEMARAPLLTFLDSDDEFLPHRLRSTLALFDADPSLSLAISSFDTIKAGKTTSSVNAPGMIAAGMLERALIAQILFIAGSAITVRKQASLSVGGFDPDLMRLQDREFLLRLSRYSGALFTAEPDWRKHASPGSISGRPVGYVKAYGEMLAKNRYIREQHPEMVKYLIARRIVEQVLRGRLSVAVEEHRTNRASPVLGFSALELVRGYRGGKRQRSLVRRELAAAMQAQSTSLALSRADLLPGAVSFSPAGLTGAPGMEVTVTDTGSLAGKLSSRPSSSSC